MGHRSAARIGDGAGKPRASRRLRSAERPADQWGGHQDMYCNASRPNYESIRLLTWDSLHEVPPKFFEFLWACSAHANEER
jgi:hypothetical protein